DTGAHPTILANSPSDVRIVNAYRQEDLRYGLFNVLHSGGKGIYQQSIDPALLGTFLAEVPSFAMEECIGRFYENILGRSRGFWSYFFDQICAAVPDFSERTPRDFYEDVNRISSSRIRLEADQLTYLLHIIIRYELERELINGRLTVSNLPQAWNQKYEDYLGMSPENDREGVLQDIHWAAGYVGYFPTYIVADLTAAQLAASIEKECGSLESLMETGNFAAITDWLRANIFCSGARYTAEELTLRATGEPLTSGYYMDYLRKKFSEVYNLTNENEKEKKSNE
ncbi:MAG: carboxypeptidase M32, partial [Anaerovoracaceae bacterium]